MATLKAANITNYDAGGSGDNYIADGYIKSVEKVWIDSIALGTVALGSDDSIAIGRVPKNKKITEVMLYIPSVNPTATVGTVFIDSGATMLMTSANTYLGALQADGVAAGTETYATSEGQLLRLTGDKNATVTPNDVVLYVKLVLAGGGDAISTGGTIRSIIKYT